MESYFHNLATYIISFLFFLQPFSTISTMWPDTENDLSDSY